MPNTQTPPFVSVSGGTKVIYLPAGIKIYYGLDLIQFTDPLLGAYYAITSDGTDEGTLDSLYVYNGSVFVKILEPIDKNVKLASDYSTLGLSAGQSQELFNKAVASQLDYKLDKPTSTGSYYVTKIVSNGTAYYQYNVIDLQPGDIPVSRGTFISASAMYESYGNNIGINTKLPQEALDVNGNVKSNSYKFTLQSSVTPQPNMLIVKTDGSGLVWYNNSSVGADIPIYSSPLSNYVARWDGTKFVNGTIQDNGTNVGIGAPALGARLDVRAQGNLETDIVFRVRNSDNTQDFLVVNGAGDVYNRGANGNLYNTFFGENVGRNSVTTDNNAFGYNALSLNTTGTHNSVFGGSALYSNITGSQNIAFGNTAGSSTMDGSSNTASNNSIYIGFDTRANADNETNQIVIGHSAIGNGSN